jgi:hypothetical protein
MLAKPIHPKHHLNNLRRWIKSLSAKDVGLVQSIIAYVTTEEQLDHKLEAHFGDQHPIQRKHIRRMGMETYPNWVYSMILHDKISDILSKP